MRAAEFLPDVNKVLNRRGELAYRLEQTYSALTGVTNLPRGLRATKDLRGHPAVLSR